MTIDRVHHEDENQRWIARDGEVVRVPLLTTDNALPSLTFEDVEVPQVFDSYGNRAGHRPGAVYLNKPAPVAVDRAAIDAVHMTHDMLVSDAWRRPGAATPVAVTDREQAYSQYEDHQANAWRKRGAR